MTPTARFRRDALERIGMTAAQAAVGTLAGPEIVDALGLADGLKPIAVVAVASGLSWLKALIARRLGNTSSASLDPTI